MKREILSYKRHVSGCCPGHDDYTDDRYANRLSTRARARGKQKEHKLVRTLAKRKIAKDRRISIDPLTGNSKL